MDIDKIIDRLEEEIAFSKSNGDEVDICSWSREKGCLLTQDESLFILAILKKYKDR